MATKAGATEAETQSARWDAEEPDERKGGVYFLATPDRTMVKIGKSTDVKSRAGDISRMSPTQLEVLAIVRGYTNVEKWMHRRWKHLRAHGEWFKADSELLAFIGEAANDRDVTLKLCRPMVGFDEEPPRPEPRFERPPPPTVGDEADILFRWHGLGGHDVNVGMIELDWESLSDRARYVLAEVDGVWCAKDSGTPIEFGYVGYNRIANQLVDFTANDERQLAFIYSAMRDALGDGRLGGEFHDKLWMRMESRVGLDGRARHWLPTEAPLHDKCECRHDWYDFSAKSEVEWLERLVHLARMEEYVLGEIVNADRPYDRWRKRRTA